MSRPVARFQAEAWPPIVNADGFDSCLLRVRVYLGDSQYPEPDQRLTVHSLRCPMGEFVAGPPPRWKPPFLLQNQGYEEPVRLLLKVEWEDQQLEVSCMVWVRGCQIQCTPPAAYFFPAASLEMAVACQFLTSEGREILPQPVPVNWQAHDLSQGRLHCGFCGRELPCSCGPRHLKVAPEQAEPAELQAIHWQQRPGCEPVREGRIVWRAEVADAYEGRGHSQAQIRVLLGFLTIEVDSGCFLLECEPAAPPGELQVDWIFFQAEDELEWGGRIQTCGPWSEARRLPLPHMAQQWEQFRVPGKPLALGLRVELSRAGVLWGNSELFAFRLD